MFVATKIYVSTSILLSRQAYFCRDKSVTCGSPRQRQCKRFNSLHMTPRSHVDMESQKINLALAQSAPGSDTETHRGGGGGGGGGSV